MDSVPNSFQTKRLLRGLALFCLGVALIALGLGNLIAHRTEPVRSIEASRSAAAELLEGELPADVLRSLSTGATISDQRRENLDACSEKLLTHSEQMTKSMARDRRLQAKQAGDRSAVVIILGTVVMIIGLRGSMREMIRLQQQPE